MPRLQSDIVHTAQTDHRLLRRALEDLARPAEQAAQSRPLGPGEVHLVHFHRQLLDRESRAGRNVSRDLGMALVSEARKSEGSPASANFARLALHALEPAVTRRDQYAASLDGPVLEAFAYALWRTGRHDEAWTAYQTGLAQAPNRELMRFDLVRFLYQTRRWDEAIPHCKRLIELNPWQAVHHDILARLYAETGHWNRAVESCHEALRLDPALLDVRRRLVSAYLQQGKKTDAEAEFKTLLRFDPPNQEEWERWWLEQSKSR